jgi:hypothetical protein
MWVGFLLSFDGNFCCTPEVKYQIMTHLKIHCNNVLMESRKKEEPGFEHPPIFLILKIIKICDVTEVKIIHNMF